MPTKRELLEEKTVKELKQMAKDRDLSGYSNKRKDELIDIISANYLKADIEAWPKIAEKPEEKVEGEVEEVEKTPEEVEIDIPELEKELEKVTEEKVETEADSFKYVIIGVTIGIIIVAIAGLLILG